MQTKPAGSLAHFQKYTHAIPELCYHYHLIKTRAVSAHQKDRLSMARFTDELRALAGAKWDAVVEHKFTNELAAGTVADGVLARYLIQDHRFLDAFVVLLASMVAAAPTLADRIPGCQFLALVTGRENTYFERSFDALGVDQAARVDTPNAPPTSAFDGLMREAAKASYPEMLAVLVVAEWRCIQLAARAMGRLSLALTLTATVMGCRLGLG